MNKYVAIIAVLGLSACASPVKIVNSAGTELRGVPYPEMGLWRVTGRLTSHTIKDLAKDCIPQPAKQRVLAPTGNFLYARSGANPFSSNEISVSFHANGTLNTLNAEQSSPAAGVVSAITSLAGVFAENATNGNDGSGAKCNTAFVADGAELLSSPTNQPPKLTPIVTTEQ